MTPKDKAKQLLDQYFEYVEANSVQGQLDNAKMCALIAVNEIIVSVLGGDWSSPLMDYWQEVKQEINLLS